MEEVLLVVDGEMRGRPIVVALLLKDLHFDPNENDHGHDPLASSLSIYQSPTTTTVPMMSHFTNKIVSLILAALLVLLSHAQNFDCADQKQALSFCALTNSSATTSLTDCISCVYPEFPTDPT